MAGIAFISNAYPTSGVGYHAAHVADALKTTPGFERHTLVDVHIDGVKRTVVFDGVQVAQVRVWPVLNQKTINWIRLGKIAQRQLSSGVRLLHLTNQTLSFLVSSNIPSVLTVHDLIELNEPQSFAGGLAAKYLYSGIDRAAHYICVSNYTAQQLQKSFSIPDEKITVIYNGVGQEIHPITNFGQSIAYHTLCRELKVTPDAFVILYVGSDHPRKNVLTAFNAFQQLHVNLPNALFIKVGEAGLPAGRAQLLEAIDRYHLADSVRLVGSVSFERLNELYNLAHALIFPSRAEGFGLPPLQAMACGLPVVASNATSVPEVVGDAALLRAPDDTEGFAQDLRRIHDNATLVQQLKEKGLARAKQFSWDEAAKKTLEVYNKVLASYAI